MSLREMDNRDRESVETYQRDAIAALRERNATLLKENVELKRLLAEFAAKLLIEND